MTDATQAHPGHGSKGYRAYVLFALLLIYTFNFIDRALVGIVQEPIRREFSLDDGAMGWLGGPAFAILYTLLGIPIARWAERGNRITIIALGAALWSAMTVACGSAMNFTQLLLARIGVGIGEAGCTPPAHSAISDYFPSERRASALSIYALGVPVGTALAAVGGGWLAQNFDWRFAFWALGAPGLIAAILLKITVREPPRSGSEVKAPSFGETWKTLSSKACFWHVAFGSALVSFVGYASAQFLPTYMLRTYHLSLLNTSFAFGIIAGFAAGLGTFLGGVLADRLRPKHPRVATWLPALGLAVALPLYLLAFAFQGSFTIAFGILLIAPIFHYLYLGPIYAVTQSIVQPRMRATATAILILIINLIGYGLGPPLLGNLANIFTDQVLAQHSMTLTACHGIEDGVCATARQIGLRNALLAVTCVLAWPIVHFLLAGRTYLKDRVS